VTEVDTGGEAQGGNAAALAATVLEEEAARQAAQARAKEQVIFPDDLLPGVNSEPVSFKQAFAAGGRRTFIILGLLLALDELESAGLYALGPEIARSLGVSKGTILFISTTATAFYVLGAVPMGWLADRVRRVPIVGTASFVFAGFVALTGLVTSGFAMFWTRFGAGISKANTIPVHQSLIADTYPIGIRARMAGSLQMGAHAIGITSPILVTAIATWAGGDDGWRWAFLVLWIPVAIVACFAFTMKEPPRGQFEKADVLGEVFVDENPAPISMEAAFTRLKKIATIRTSIAAFCALGFGLFSQFGLEALYLDENFPNQSLIRRGLVLSLSGIAALPFLPIVGGYFDRTYRSNPAKALALVGLLIIPSALFAPLQFSTTSEVWFVIFKIPQAIFTTCALAMVSPVLQGVCPYRLRGMGAAMGTMYIFFIGGFLGSIIAGLLTDSIGIRGTVIVLAVPTSIIGGLLLMNGARYIRNDLSLVVEELLEEQEEYHKRLEEGAETPALQVANIDFSYGPVQVLFDVNFEIKQGETVALLGTNGAGKSTILRVISGLEVPERGVVRMAGRNITYVSPEQRAKLGIMQLPGGKGVFPSLTVNQNLAVSARMLGGSTSEIDARIDKVLEVFPELAERRSQAARSLSGGQQQMLALARVLIHDPQILLIDELSLGLAPVVVQRMLEIVDDLKARGQTMVIVEQSLNVALAISDRAIFLEKGQVKFEGPAAELMERDDLARAVFFGAEGG
jgi:ABC-type branched-subunit amino acid transport system ATPase component/predicted MFS family arabinose efflux permease